MQTIFNRVHGSSTTLLQKEFSHMIVLVQWPLRAIGDKKKKHLKKKWWYNLLFCFFQALAFVILIYVVVVLAAVPLVVDDSSTLEHRWGRNVILKASLYRWLIVVNMIGLTTELKYDNTRPVFGNQLPSIGIWNIDMIDVISNGAKHTKNTTPFRINIRAIWSLTRVSWSFLPPWCPLSRFIDWFRPFTIMTYRYIFNKRDTMNGSVCKPFV